MSMTAKHHGSEDCAHVCCTRFEGFGVDIGGERIFADVNLHVHCGQLTAIIGRNGAGKSTLIRAILGDVPHRGTIRYTDAAGDPLHRRAQPLIGYVPQLAELDRTAPVTVQDLFAATWTSTPVWWRTSAVMVERAHRTLARVQAEHLLRRRLGTLSGGELQRVLLALALEPTPNLLLLDEPERGIDHRGMGVFYELLSKLRQTDDLAVILISHDLDLVAQYADQVVLFDRGLVLADRPDVVLSDVRAKNLLAL